jgi:hypothetical protein
VYDPLGVSADAVAANAIPAQARTKLTAAWVIVIFIG